MTPGEAVAVKRTIGTHMNIRTQETACEGVFVVVAIITGVTDSIGLFQYWLNVNRDSI